MCLLVRRTYNTGDMCSAAGEHMSLVICVSWEGEHISLVMWGVWKSRNPESGTGAGNGNGNGNGNGT